MRMTKIFVFFTFLIFSAFDMYGAEFRENPRVMFLFFKENQLLQKLALNIDIRNFQQEENTSAAVKMQKLRERINQGFSQYIGAHSIKFFNGEQELKGSSDWCDLTIYSLKLENDTPIIHVRIS